MKLSIILLIFLSLLSFSYQDSKKKCEIQYKLCNNRCAQILLALYRSKCMTRCSELYMQCIKKY